ncbi:MAG TPA: hypothetical protein VNS79_12945 [Sphingobium sp.]|nr:hypothetical protein [Sphingobium sp.]
MTLLHLILRHRWAQGLALGVVVILLLAVIDRCARHAVTAATRSATQAGRDEQRADYLQETIRQTEKANAAADKIRRDGPARDDCLLDNRSPENC